MTDMHIPKQWLAVQVSQHELYSSRIRDFEVRGRQKHPRHDAAAGGGEPGKSTDYGRSLNSTAWKLVGNFTAAKVKGTQSFKVGIADLQLWQGVTSDRLPLSAGPLNAALVGMSSA